MDAVMSILNSKYKIGQWIGIIRLKILFILLLTSQCLFSEVLAAQVKPNDAVILLNERKAIVKASGRMITHVRRKIEINSLKGVQLYNQIPITYMSSIQEVIVKEAFVVKKDSGLSDYAKIRKKTSWFPVKQDKIIIHFEHCEPGDIIEYSLKLIQKEPLIKDHFWNIFIVQDMALTKQAIFRITLPIKMAFYYKSYKIHVSPDVIRESNVKIYSWYMNDIPPIVIKSKKIHIKKIVVSSSLSWKTIADWANKNYYSKMALDLDVKQKIDELVTNQEPSDFKILRLLNYFTSKVRFQSDATGLGAYTPKQAMSVIKSGKGDCKDMSVLFVSMFKEIGIQSFPVLFCKYNPLIDFDVEFPVPYYFSHTMIVIPQKNDTYLWVDPTRLGRKYNIRTPLGMALILKGDSFELLRIGS